MRTCILSAIASLLLITSSWGQPTEFSDDLITAATYDSASLLAPCYGGPLAKYSVFDPVPDLFNDHAVSGEGFLRMTSRLPDSGVVGPRFILATLGHIGFNIGCPGEPSLGSSTFNFTSPEVCLYADTRFTAWELDVQAGGF